MKNHLSALSVLLCIQLAGENVPRITPGAESVEEYITLLEGKRVSVLSNHSGMVTPRTHVVDTLLSRGINIVSIFSPEHGFRGTVSEGEKIGDSIDDKTGIPIRSLYNGKSPYPSEQDVDAFDILVFDIQDVGCRFYTYYVTMTRMMEVCAARHKPIVILDRPNPIGFYVDGPIIDLEKYKSGVGYLPIPVCHGMTLGELAGMINGERWLPDGIRCELKVIKCRNYTHRSRYVLPVKPSPNLPDMRSVYLYPSLCYLEATPVSVGRGTDFPFHVYGHPNFSARDTSFTPRSKAGARKPLQCDKTCYGRSLSVKPDIEEIIAKGINLEYVIDAYNNMNIGNWFFNNSFEKLIGVGYVRTMIIGGASADEIKARWEDDVKLFKEKRKPYLLYEE